MNNLVDAIWVENGHKGFLELNILIGHGENLKTYSFYLNLEQTTVIANAMLRALHRRFGVPRSGVTKNSRREDLMELEVTLSFLPNRSIGIGRPCDWRAIWRTNNVIHIKTEAKMRFQITFTSEAVAKHALEQLLDNDLRTIELGKDVTKMISCDGMFIAAQELTAEDEAHPGS